MSRETETVRDFYDAVNRRDFEQAERYFHPEVEIFPAIGGELDARRRYRGREEGREVLEWIADGFEVTVEIEEVIESGSNLVLQRERWRPRGRQGIETPIELYDLYEVEAGLIRRINGFREREEAFNAAGLA
jgi:ketosteroid isomerase-like protein